MNTKSMPTETAVGSSPLLDLFAKWKNEAGRLEQQIQSKAHKHDWNGAMVAKIKKGIIQTHLRDLKMVMRDNDGTQRRESAANSVVDTSDAE